MRKLVSGSRVREGERLPAFHNRRPHAELVEPLCQSPCHNQVLLRTRNRNALSSILKAGHSCVFGGGREESNML